MADPAEGAPADRRPLGWRAPILGAWLAPAALAGLATGLWLLLRNSDRGIAWQAPLVFFGAPLGLLCACALAAGLLALAASARAAFLRDPAVHAAAAAFLVGAWFANAAGRSLSLPGALRIPGSLLLGALASALAARAARVAAGAALARGLAAVALLGTLGFGLSAASLTWDARAARSDPRAAVPRFDPLPDPPARAPISSRLIVLGLDGATWDRIDPLIAAGRLPNLERLRREGACGRLRTIQPTLSAAIWTTVATGRTPNDHGIRRHYLHQVRFLRLPNLRLETWMSPVRELLARTELLRVLPVTSNLRRCKAIWNIASEAGLRVAMLGWWASHPPEPVNGWIVSEFASAARGKELADRGRARNYDAPVTTHPPELIEELSPLERPVESIAREDLAAFLPVDDEVWAEYLASETFGWERPLTIFRATYRKDLFFAEAALHLDRTRRPDLLLSYLKGIDVFGHVFWKYSAREAIEEGEDPALVARYRDCVDRAYEWTDRLLGRYLERLGPGDTIVVLSDHGWQREGRRRYAHHDAPDGILAVAGAHARAGAWIEGAHVLDVGPTLLHLLGLPKGEDMPGRVLAEFLDSDLPARSIPTWETARAGSLDALDLAGAEEREHELRALGYVK